MTILGIMSDQRAEWGIRCDSEGIVWAVVFLSERVTDIIMELHPALDSNPKS
jgi:hypothetical protein